MSRFLDTALAGHHRVKIEAPQPWSIPHPVIVKWKPAIATVRGESARFEGVISDVAFRQTPRRGDYMSISGLVAVLRADEIESIQK